MTVSDRTGTSVYGASSNTAKNLETLNVEKLWNHYWRKSLFEEVKLKLKIFLEML